MARKPNDNSRLVDQDAPTVIDIGDDEEEQDVEVAATEEATDSGVTKDDLARSQISLAKAIESLADSQPVKKVPFARMKIRTPFNPTGVRGRADKLTRRYYQNGSRLRVSVLHDEELRLLELLKPGLYINNMVRVSEVQNGSEVDVFITYKNKGIDTQLANKEHWRSFTELLQKCVAEAKGASVLVTR